MRPSKSEQIAQRRALILKLYSRGYSQQKIADELESYKISRQTVGVDLKIIKEESEEFVKNHRETLSFEYRQVLSNLYQLREEAWTLMERAKDANGLNDPQLAKEMFGIIQSINGDILDARAIADIIKQDVTKRQKESVEAIQKKMNKVIEQNENNDVFSQSTKSV